MLSSNSEVSVLQGTTEARQVHAEDRGVPKAGHHASTHDAHAEADIRPQDWQRSSSVRLPPSCGSSMDHLTHVEWRSLFLWHDNDSIGSITPQTMKCIFHVIHVEWAVVGRRVYILVARRTVALPETRWRYVRICARDINLHCTHEWALELNMEYSNRSSAFLQVK